MAFKMGLVQRLRFSANNKAAEGRRLKALIKRSLGRDSSSEAVEQLFADTKAVFLALVRSVGSDAPAVHDTLARRARWGILSAHHALRAVEVGLETDAGQKLLEMALKLDARAERLDVTAIDLANRLDGNKPTENAVDAFRREIGALK